MQTAHILRGAEGPGRNPSREKQAGFTLTEVIIVVGLTGMVIAGSISALLYCQQLWSETNNELERVSEAAQTLQKIVGGVYGNPGLRMAIYDPTVPTPAITVTNGFASRIDFTYQGSSYFYEHDGGMRVVDQDGAIICENVDRLLFSMDGSKPGTVKIDLTLSYSDAVSAETFIRLVSWVALRNRP